MHFGRKENILCAYMWYYSYLSKEDVEGGLPFFCFTGTSVVPRDISDDLNGYS